MPKGPLNASINRRTRKRRDSSAGKEPVNFDRFRTLPSSTATGARQVGEVDQIGILERGDENQQPTSTSIGLLGAKFVLDQGAYQISKIYEGAPWDIHGRGPLSQPGVDVKEGDYLLAINGVPIETRTDPWAAFQCLAGRHVILTVSQKPKIDTAARDVMVQPLESEGELRWRAWVERNRAYVDRRTGGKLGYICMPYTSDFGMAELASASLERATLPTST